MAIGGSIRPDISNPAGYYEDLDIVRLHATHLRRGQRFSHGWRCAPRQFLRFNPAERHQAQELAALRSVTHAHWGWKDPRTTLFLTEWKEIIPDLKVILPWRPCAAVAASLVARGIQQRRLHLLIDPVSAIRMWQAHNRLACDYAAQFPADTIMLPVVQFDARRESVGARLAAWSVGALFAAPEPDLQIAAPHRRQAPSSLVFLCWLLGCERLEARLHSLSAGCHPRPCRQRCAAA
jgi:hypothetical protein